MKNTTPCLRTHRLVPVDCRFGAQRPKENVYLSKRITEPALNFRRFGVASHLCQSDSRRSGYGYTVVCRPPYLYRDRNIYVNVWPLLSAAQRQIFARQRYYKG